MSATDGGPVFIGGNSLGVISHPGRYDTMFIPETKLPKSRGDHKRKTCFLSQSGAFIIANLSRMPWFDPAFALSIGNQIDLTASDLLSFIKDDPDIDVFAVYMEGFQPGDGLAFARRSRETVALGKDVVFYKAGRTSEGRSATAGHTASVAGDYAVCEAAMDEAGAWVATDFNEFSDLLRLLSGFEASRSWAIASLPSPTPVSKPWEWPTPSGGTEPRCASRRSRAETDGALEEISTRFARRTGRRQEPVRHHADGRR